jgi:hypothetical protein
MEGGLPGRMNIQDSTAFQISRRTSTDHVIPLPDVSNDSSAGGSSSVVVSGFCASDNVCASNGAQCSSDDQCYNYCGTDGVCGGEGAGCNTQSAFEAGQSGIACSGDCEFTSSLAFAMSIEGAKS